MFGPACSRICNLAISQQPSILSHPGRPCGGPLINLIFGWPAVAVALPDRDVLRPLGLLGFSHGALFHQPDFGVCLGLVRLLAALLFLVEGDLLALLLAVEVLALVLCVFLVCVCGLLLLL